MKYTYISLSLLLIPLLLASCLKDQEDIFEKPASERLEAAMKETHNILISAENGWKLDLYPSKTQAYGGYTLFLDFDSESVTVACEINERIMNLQDEIPFVPGYVETSKWKMLGTAGPVISFDTHNNLIHYFSGPDKDFGNIDVGLQGDFEFSVLEATKDRIKLKGLKTENIIYMTPIKAREDWEDLMNKYREADMKMQWYSLEYKHGNISYSASMDPRVITVTYGDENGAIVQKHLPYIFTLDGIKFYEEVNISGVSISEMNYKVEGDRKFFEDINGSGITFEVKILSLVEQFAEGQWYFSLSKVGSSGQNAWLTHAILTARNGFETIYIYLGQNAGVYGLHANLSGFSGSLLYYSPIIEGKEDEIILQFAGRGNENGVYFYNNLGVGQIVQAMKAGTYTIEGDQPGNPRYITLTDKSDPNNKYVLSRYQVYRPLKNQ